MSLLYKMTVRRYQTKTGVFGYLPRTKEKYKTPEEVLKLRAQNSNFYRLVTAYREHGHKKANINPIALTKPEEVPELDPTRYDLKLDQQVPFKGLIEKRDQDKGSVQEAIQFLEETYCKNIGYEFSYVPEEEYQWLSKKIEGLEPVPVETERKLMELLLKGQEFDHFLAAKFATFKRYGGEGAESMIAMFYQLLVSCQKHGISDLVLGMTHRGRLNILTVLLKLPPAIIFRKIKGLSELPPTAKASGDVVSHLTCSADIGSVHVTIVSNPSHLEAVNPVSMGKARAKQLMAKEGDYGKGDTRFGEKIINVQCHGDAAFPGQGVNQETLILGCLPHFRVGGGIHIIGNNQVGFTTPPENGRGTRYASDLAKLISAPVFHVNGDFPDKVAQLTEIAVAYQREFRKTIFIDLNCYRQWGHNELDDPTFTNPAVYNIIHNRDTVPNLYAKKLTDQKVVAADDVEKIKKDFYNELNKDLKDESFAPAANYFQKQWSGMTQAGRNLTTWDTGFDTNILRYIGIKSVQYPENFNIHKHLLKTFVKSRLKKMNSPDERIDWATAECMAVGSLLYQGFNVRISGEDVGRGTFSHRHFMFVDQETNDIYIPLNSLTDNQGGKLEVVNSPLSEEAVIGYEYGMSLENPNNLVIWEAQFGDFYNGAQIMVDNFISCGETKWMKCSGLVMVLPHGYDGAGSEHSSARIERFLQLTDSKETQADGDDVNFQVVFPTTPAQIFHLLRRQIIRNYRKPLIVIGPKVLLRLPEATSLWSEFDVNSNFENIIPDNFIEPSKVNRLVFTSGKHFYNIDKKRKELNRTDTAIVRVESLCPFPTYDLQKLTDKYTSVTKYIWCQEEPRNMGAWTFIEPRFRNLVGVQLEYVGSPEQATVALQGEEHNRVQNKVLEDLFQ